MDEILSDGMAKAKKYVLLSERRETWRMRVIRQMSGYCNDCGRETIWLTPQEIARMTFLTREDVGQLIIDGRVHYFEHAETTLICGLSLGQHVQTAETGSRR